MVNIFLDKMNFTQKVLMKTLLNIIFITAYFLLFAVSPLAAEKHVASAKTIVRVGVFPLEPLNFLDTDNEALGVYPDLIREIARLENWTIQFVPGSWGDCMDNLQADRIDLITTIAYSEERAKTIDYNHEPVIDIWGQVYIRPGEKINNILDLDGKRVAIAKKDINGLNFLKMAEQFKVDAEIVEMQNHRDILEGIRKMKVDAGVVPQHFGLRHSSEYDVVGTSIIFSPFSVYFGTKKGKNMQLLEKIDLYLAKWKADKNSFYYQRLSYWMGGKKYTREVIPQWILIVLLGVLISSIILICFIYALKKTVTIRTKELLDANTDLIIKTEQLERNKQELSTKHAEFLAIFNSIVDAIVFVDVERRILMVNPAFETIMGYKPNEVIGKSTHFLYADQADYQRQGNIRFHKNAHVSSPTYEIAYRRKDGTVFPSETLGVPVKNQHGENIGFLGVIRDITDRINAEKENDHLKKQFLQAQKMEAIGTMAGGIAHDFNNILAIILGNAEMAKDDIPDGNPAKYNIEQVLRASNRAKELVRQILSFSRKSEQELLPIHPCLIIKETLKMLRSTTPASISIVQNICEDDCKILADSTQLHQLLMNLFTNAVQAMDEKGTISVSVEMVHLNQQEIARFSGLSAGEHLMIKVSDTGAGMDKEILDRIYDPFFTTKEVDKGTGMGLSIVHGIVKSHKGFIEVESTPGEGTTFTLLFPIIDEVQIQEPQEIEEEYPRGDERILFVDDEVMLAEMGFRLLTRQGYQVTAQTSSSTALDIFKNAPDSFDLVITDQSMPMMTGLDLATELLKLRPDIPIIICTGYSNKVSEETCREHGIKAFCLKPLDSKKLVQTVRRVLDESQD